MYPVLILLGFSKCKHLLWGASMITHTKPFCSAQPPAPISASIYYSVISTTPATISLPNTLSSFELCTECSIPMCHKNLHYLSSQSGPFSLTLLLGNISVKVLVIWLRTSSHHPVFFTTSRQTHC